MSCSRQGYLFVQAKKNLKLGTAWTKYFCQYQAKTKTLTLIPYNQLAGKITSGDTLRVTGCVCHDDMTEKFRFSVTGEDLSEDGLGMVSSCRYSNVPWSDCDPLTWLRTKTVNLVKDKKYRSV